VGIAVINTIGNLAGFAGPHRVGWMTDLFGAAKWGLISIGVVMIFGALAVLRLGSAPA
jgi:ACS family tartrate transporter-like MFS transporter